MLFRYGYKGMDRVILRNSCGTKSHPLTSDIKQDTTIGPQYRLGRMPFVTKDIQVRYLYWLGWMPLSPGWMSSVTKYIKTCISQLISWIHAGGMSVIGPWHRKIRRQPSPRHPFGAQVKEISVLDPEKFLTIFDEKNILRLQLHNNNIEYQGTNRGDGMLRFDNIRTVPSPRHVVTTDWDYIRKCYLEKAN